MSIFFRAKLTPPYGGTSSGRTRKTDIPEGREALRILDIGTGGGFPGIPLAILFPGLHFHLIDSIGKKITAVADIIQKLELTNATCECIRAENVKENYDAIVSRATADLKTLDRYAKRITPREVYCLKGGDLKKEIRELGKPVQLYPISEFFAEEYFRGKYVVWIPYWGIHGFSPAPWARAANSYAR